MPIKSINYENRKPGTWDNYFTVSGGPFAQAQTWGWYCTDEGGHSLAVSPSMEFCQIAQRGLRLMQLLKKADAKYQLGERRDQGYMDGLSDDLWEELRLLLKAPLPNPYDLPAPEAARQPKDSHEA